MARIEISNVDKLDNAQIGSGEVWIGGQRVDHLPADQLRERGITRSDDE